jgi:type IX secretion system PorP/SprF family membrane protein
MRQIVFLLIIILGFAFKVFAQQDISVTQYYMAMGYYNPATAGLSGELDIIGMTRKQWVGFTNAPSSIYATANMPYRFMNRDHGVGVTFSRDNQSSLYGRTIIGLQYAYLKKIKKGTLRVGVQLGMINFYAGGDNVVLPVDSAGNTGQNDDAIPTSKISTKMFDANLGIYYHTDRFYFGVAASHLLEPEVDEENLQTFVAREYNFTAGYNIKTNNPFLEMQPSIFLRTDFNMYKVDVTVRSIFAKRFSGGLSWRKDEAIAILLGVTFGKIQAGYAYDFPIGIVRKGTSGSHELFLKYRLQLNKPKTGMSKHKSVRIL